MTVPFERQHDILIDVPPEAVFDYVCNPNSWPEWLAASHFIEGPQRALAAGETFFEKWQIRRGEVSLDWTVVESDRPRLWTVRAETDFIGPIVVSYTFEPVGKATKYTRHLRNPDRPAPPTPDQLARVDEDARIGLENIKRILEERAAQRA